MADAAVFNLEAFQPYGGGQGARLATVTGTSSSVAIPGLAGGQQGPNSRVVVSNGGSVSAFVFFGSSGAVATTASLEILPGTKETLKPPFIGPQAMFLAAITAGGTTSINVCAGVGT